MSSSVDQIKSKIDIVTLVSSYIKLEKAGTNFKGRCPFHNEKTPSFFVSPDRGSYYCFGCQAKGDIFTFVQEFEGLDFIGSLKVLAERAGVELDNYKNGEKTEKERLFSVLETAVFFFQNKLSENKTALDYLYSRGLNDDSIKNFRIGYAPSEWRQLHEYLSSKGISDKDMLSVGLIKQKDNVVSRSGYYDTFRGRIMFPISDSSGRVVGFSGRILVPDEKAPKYLNTPETELFNKSEVLFGLDKAKKDIRLKDYSILVEGQMDLVMMHQVGLTNTVASSGTALTEMHLNKLRRFSDRIMMLFDSDSAGFAASNKAAKMALALGMEFKFFEMPEGKDPADLAKENPISLRKTFEDSKDIVQFYINKILAKDLNPQELAIEIRQNIFPYIVQMQKTDQSKAILDIRKATYINEEALWEDLKKISVNPNWSDNVKSSAPPGRRVEAIERRMYGILVWQKQNKTEDRIVDIDKIEKKIKDIFKDRWEQLEQIFEKEKELILFETESYYSNKTKIDMEIDELLVSLEEEYLKKELSEAMVSLQKAEQKKDSGEVLRYLEECQRITQRINTIKTIKNAYEKQ